MDPDVNPLATPSTASSAALTSTPLPQRPGQPTSLKADADDDDDGVEVIEDSSEGEGEEEEDDEGSGQDDEDGDEEEEEEAGENEENEDEEDGDDEEDEDEEDSDDDDDDDDEEEDDSEEEEEETHVKETKKVAIVPPLKIKREQLTKKLAKAVKTERPDSESPVPKRKPGRPSRAEMERREKEREERIARGEEPEPTPKRRGRKPMDPALKAKLKEERQKAVIERREARKEETRRKHREKMRRKRLGIENEEDDYDGGDGPKKPGRKKRRAWTEEEKIQREKARKAKMEENKRLKAIKEEKRRATIEKLREQRKQKKAEEARQREAYEKRMQELKATFLDDNTRMSSNLDASLLDESSQSSLSKVPNQELSNLDLIHQVTADTLFEYKWPLEGKNSEYYFLQEQVSEYLGVKSFKRRYPNIPRKKINHQERDFLLEMKIINETQADLGLTAIPSTEVLDIMSRDFFEKYDEYMAVVMARKDRNRQTGYSTSVPVERHQLADFITKAINETAAWNKTMNAERKEKRRACFDMQTFAIHYPQNNKGKMRVVEKPKLGFYPISLIPGQFTDHYRSFTSNQMKHLPMNTAIKAAPNNPKAFHMALALAKAEENKKKRKAQKEKENAAKRRRHSGGSESNSSGSSGSDSDGSSSSDSDSDSSFGSSSSSSDEEDDVALEEEKVGPQFTKVVIPPMKQPIKPTKQIDADIPLSTCKTCQGNRQNNKIGQPEVMLNCSKCDNSMHPTCIGLNIELLEFVTNYNWECTECKNCAKCEDHGDEEKMLFCDLCDRGYHIYCVGLKEIPSGRWHCVECSLCSLCGATEPMGGEEITEELLAKRKGKQIDWVFEYKPGATGGKVYSHTLCIPCHRLWKKGQFCPECNICFGREKSGGRGNEVFSKVAEVEYANCWVCQRTHHAICVGDPNRFICLACQQKTQAKCVGLAGNVTTVTTEMTAHQNASFSANTSASTSFTYTRSGRRAGAVQTYA